MPPIISPKKVAVDIRPKSVVSRFQWDRMKGLIWDTATSSTVAAPTKVMWRTDTVSGGGCTETDSRKYQRYPLESKIFIFLINLKKLFVITFLPAESDFIKSRISTNH